MLNFGREDMQQNMAGTVHRGTVLLAYNGYKTRKNKKRGSLAMCEKSERERRKEIARRNRESKLLLAVCCWRGNETREREEE